MVCIVAHKVHVMIVWSTTPCLNADRKRVYLPKREEEWSFSTLLNLEDRACDFISSNS